MRVVLAAMDEALARAWEAFCGDVPGVTVHRGSILDVACDAVVSPANSFGFMDGGIDAQYMHFFGPEIQLRVRRAIYGATTASWWWGTRTWWRRGTRASRT